MVFIEKEDYLMNILNITKNHIENWMKFWNSNNELQWVKPKHKTNQTRYKSTRTSIDQEVAKWPLHLHTLHIHSLQIFKFFLLWPFQIRKTLVKKMIHCLPTKIVHYLIFPNDVVHVKKATINIALTFEILK